jgi:hypothetical protein
MTSGAVNTTGSTFDSGKASPPSGSARQPNESPNNAVTQKEVDYYLNPTELFRWINYRRWDGAKSRALSHPDESSTWIVSRHSSDGRVLWRHLPIHLVCMQSDNVASDNPSTIRQIEELLEVLLETYPEGASSADDQGMLPLHLTAANCSQPNDRILNILLMCYPAAVNMKDVHGRTPIDILNEKVEDGPRRAAAFRSMSRARTMTERLVASIREENSSVIESLKQTATNERMASQRIIVRLEEELENSRKKAEDLEHRNKDGIGSYEALRKEVEGMEEERENNNKIIQLLKRERQELLDQNEFIRNQLEEHENIVNSLKQQYNMDLQDRSDMIAQLKSEVSTSRAMAEALESQLRSRFTNEEYLTATVSELETKISDMNANFQQEKANLIRDRDAYENENTQLKRNVEEITKKASGLQLKLTEVNKNMSLIMSSHAALNGEHDRIVELSLQTEAELLENIRNERSKTLNFLKKQHDFFEIAKKDQEQLIEEFYRKEMEILESEHAERDRIAASISNMRQEFNQARSSILDRQRNLQSDNLLLGLSSTMGSSPRQNSGSFSISKEFRNETKLPPSNQVARHAEATITASQTIASKQASTPSSYTERSPIFNNSMKPNPVESRVPTSTIVTQTVENRQGLRSFDQSEGNLLHHLESRKDTGTGHSRRQLKASESMSFGTSTLSTAQSLFPIPSSAPKQKPRMINLTELNRNVDVAASSGTSAASSSRHTLMTRTYTNSFPTTSRLSIKTSLDEYSQNSSSTSTNGSIDESDSESSSRGGSSYSRKYRKAPRESSLRVANGMGMGMIKISEEM